MNSAASRPPQARPCLLLVDDTPANIDVLVGLLKDSYELKVANRGAKALKICEAGEPIDLILLDVMMPEMDGYEVCRRLKASETLRHIPVIFLTAKAETADIVRGFELGAVDYVSKPFNAHELRARVNTHLTIDRLHRENERLLLNILPAEIATRLKSGEAGIADHYPDISVLFADIVGFTTLSGSMPPHPVVAMLNDLFTRFDEVALRFQVEKIKTIGDCYMAVCGLPFERPDHARVLADMALEMIQSLVGFNAERGTTLQIRIGLNSGPVVAGVIGSSKFIYDLWGDTVNTASRMESSGLPDCIQITEASQAALAPHFLLEERGEIEVKGKGRLRTWLVRGRKPA